MTKSQNGQIERAQKTPGNALMQFVEQHHRDFALVLPKHMTPERMVRLAISAIRTTPKLAECSVVSFASCLMACATLGLEPNTHAGHAYLIPRRNKGQMECTLQVGYKGLIDLIYRSGMVSSIKAKAVYEGDHFEYEMGLNPKLVHRPCGEDDPSKLEYVYTVVRWKDGGEPIWDVLTRKQIIARQKRGGAGDGFSPWKTDFEAMALKTGVRAIARWAPTSTERISVTQAIAYEEATERNDPVGAANALGEQAAQGLLTMGTFPTEAEPAENSSDAGNAAGT